MHIKILVLGITGNLAQLKVIPGIAKFSESIESLKTVELIGYSRSSLDYQKLIRQLNSHSKNGKHNLTNVTLYNGDYTNNSVYHSVVQNLRDGEELWVYLAVPPEVYLPFLQQTCPYSRSPIFILVEKPFGTNLQEMTKIKAVVESCDLHQNVLFIDHYLFKAGLALQLPYSIPLNKISEVKAYAYETLGVEDRTGYYGAIGAVKDMMPHLLSTLQLQLRSITQQSLGINDLQIDSLQLAQYANAPQGLPESTPTYFHLTGKVQIKNHILKVTLASGKKLHAKETYFEFVTQAETIHWELAPESKITTSQHHITNDIILSDHERLFYDLANKNYTHFLDANEAHRSVVLEEKALQYSLSHPAPLATYPEGINPMNLDFA